MAARSRRSDAAVAPLSAFADCRTENVRVQAVVIPELELCDIERQVLFADLVECPDHAAFDQRPEALNRVCVNRADNILAVAWSTVPCGKDAPSSCSPSTGQCREG